MFNYICEECGQGTVREKIFRHYHTKIRGYPFVVDEARIGVCDKCEAKHFNAKETKRWEELYDQQLQNQDAYLSASDIRQVRESLGLTVESLAYLVGCTRQSIYNWEKTDREKPQSRMADLLIKLIRDSAQFREINVIEFLIEQAKKLGIDVAWPGKTAGTNAIRLKTKSVLEEYLKSSNAELRLAAADQERKIIVAESPTQDVIGLLQFDFERANLSLNIVKDNIGLRTVDVTVITVQGQECSRQGVQVENGAIVLLSDTATYERDIREIILERKEANQIEIQR
jgi:putative zinc finger/helix-turn-helix YgiT family protein